MSKKRKKYLKLFTTALYLSAFTFGGGYVIIPLMKKKFVDDMKWLEEKEMLNLAAIAQSAPGAVAVNAATIVGYRIAGIPGAIVSIIGTVLPPLAILSVLSLFYSAFRSNAVVGAVLKGMQAGVAAVIADVVIGMGGDVVREKSFLSIGIMAGAFIAAFLLNVNVIYIILLCGAVGALRGLVRSRLKKGDAAR